MIGGYVFTSYFLFSQLVNLLSSGCYWFIRSFLILIYLSKFYGIRFFRNSFEHF